MNKYLICIIIGIIIYIIWNNYEKFSIGIPYKLVKYKYDGEIDTSFQSDQVYETPEKIFAENPDYADPNKGWQIYYTQDEVTFADEPEPETDVSVELSTERERSWWDRVCSFDSGRLCNPMAGETGGAAAAAGGGAAAAGGGAAARPLIMYGENSTTCRYIVEELTKAGYPLAISRDLMVAWTKINLEKHRIYLSESHEDDAGLPASMTLKTLLESMRTSAETRLLGVVDESVDESLEESVSLLSSLKSDEALQVLQSYVYDKESCMDQNDIAILIESLKILNENDTWSPFLYEKDYFGEALAHHLVLEPETQSPIKIIKYFLKPKDRAVNINLYVFIYHMVMLLLEELPDDIPFHNDEVAHIINAVFYKILFYKYRYEIIGAERARNSRVAKQIRPSSTPFTFINDIELQRQDNGSYLIILETKSNTLIEPTIGILTIWETFNIINIMLMKKQEAYKEKITSYSGILSNNIYSFTFASETNTVVNPSGLDISYAKDNIDIIIKRTPMGERGGEPYGPLSTRIKWRRLQGYTGSYANENVLLNGLNDIYIYIDFTLIFYYFENFWKIFGIIPKIAAETDEEHRERMLQRYYKLPEDSNKWRKSAEEKIDRGDLSEKSSKDIFYMKYLIDFLLKSARGNWNHPDGPAD